VAEHVFLCGLSDEQRRGHPPGTVLSLGEQAGNLVLKLQQLRHTVREHPPKVRDFVEVASYVFAADRMVSRGRLTDPEVGARWRRQMRLVIAVCDLNFWCRVDVLEALRAALGFLTEDDWSFEFVENLHPVDPQLYLHFGKKAADSPGNTTVALFSGGLDSLAGAVHELTTTRRHVVLVSHRNIRGIGRRQKELASALAASYPERVTHVWLDNHIRGSKRRLEETQRTRSFFFAAMACVAAHVEGADRICFYENGVMSVNLPIAGQVVGARASRSTHPYSLFLLNHLIELVATPPLRIENPFEWRTKSEVVAQLAGSAQAGLIVTSVSCTRARVAGRRSKPHCGTCIQCLERRISTLAGGAAEYDEGESYIADFLVAKRSDGADRTMALGTVTRALDCEKMDSITFIGRFADEASWVLQGYPTEARDAVLEELVDLHRRHGTAVRGVLAEAVAARASEVLQRELPASSLLALVLASRLGVTSAADAEFAPVRLPDPKPDGGDGPTYLAVDAKRKRIRISDRAELEGPAILGIVQLIAQSALDDAGKGIAADRRTALPAKTITDRGVFPSDEAVRAAISRARETLADEEKLLYGTTADPNAIIERTTQGYRINPAVVVVTIEEFERLHPAASRRST
jgi:7-cyano-7-deazaguanine synthase in queuosine biosynthesis